MKLHLILFLSAILMISACKTGKKPTPAVEESETPLKKGVILVDYREKQKVDVYIDGDVFTSYIYPSDMKKPVLYPVRTAKGTAITRGFPIEPREGERVDHPHHSGIWLNFGDVNGFDFWNNSSAIPEEERGGYGRILHRGVKRAESREDFGVLEIAADWQVPGEEGAWQTILQEKTIFEFSGDLNSRTIDRITQLTAQGNDVVFTDNKEGMFAIRVARELEHPSESPQIFTDANGIPTEVKVLNNEGINGHYLNSEGVEGKDAWGKRARWTNLSSNIGEEDISVAIFDHPGNIGYPSYWHARDYGLFSINNLGAKVFDENSESMVVKLTPGESIVFRHRMYINSGSHASVEQLESVFEDFTTE
ncbi:PmoA family protein [Bacteroidota bacterium]